ncbi:MAG: hypothetical protein LBV69_10820 [Bacteroidales bacterium]|jgi:lipoate-protein ligase A|nr:hypothetical protein [Bacteroidales bacterium]
MFFYKSNNTNPYYNLALEDYIFNNINEEFLLCTRNEPSVLLGKNQNAYSEINLIYSKQSNVIIVRRTTGGEAIYQDTGTFNFSYMSVDKNNNVHDLSIIEKIMICFFKEKLALDIQLSVTGRIFLNKKICGGYTKIKIGDKILLHGTLAFSSQKKYLVQAKKIKSENFLLQGNRYTTIDSNLADKISIETFEKIFLDYIRYLYPHAENYNFSKEEKTNIQNLITEKYSTWDWIYGEIIDANIIVKNNTIAGNIQIYLNVENNMIKKINIYGDFFFSTDISIIEKALINCKYEKLEIQRIISNYNIEDFIFHIDNDKFVDYFFQNKEKI